jgi:hypothetical protein
MSTDLQTITGAIAGMDKVRAGLAELKEKFGGALYDVRTPDGMEAAKLARKACREPRFEVERIRKEAKAPILNLGRQLDKTAAEIETAILAVEQPIHHQITAEEERLEAEKQARIKAEADRVQRLQASLSWIRGAPARAVGKALDVANGVEAELRAFVIDESFGEFEQSARDALSEAKTALATIIAERKQYEADQAELQRRREEDERRRREQEEADRIARKQRDEQLRAEAEERDRLRREEDARRAEERAALDRQREENERIAQGLRDREAELAAKAAAKPKRAKSSLAPFRPRPEDIVQAVAERWAVDVGTAERWLRDLFATEGAA